MSAEVSANKAFHFITALKDRGITLSWTSNGVTVTQSTPGSLSVSDKATLAQLKPQVEAAVMWVHLMEQSQRRFCSNAARLYPFGRLRARDEPLLYSPIGAGRLLRVEDEEFCAFIPTGDSKPVTLRASTIEPPLLPPPRWMMEF